MIPEDVRIADGHEPKSLEELFGAPPGDPRMDSVAEAARAYLSVRKAKEQAEERTKEMARCLEQAEMALLQKMEEAGVLSVKVEDESGHVAMCSSSTSKHYGMPPGALESADFYVWLLRQGGQDLVRRTVHHMSFSGFCRELVDAGKPIHRDVKLIERKCVRVVRS